MMYVYCGHTEKKCILGDLVMCFQYKVNSKATHCNRCNSGGVQGTQSRHYRDSHRFGVRGTNLPLGENYICEYPRVLVTFDAGVPPKNTKIKEIALFLLEKYEVTEKINSF